jgi:peptide/nickel transport system substrate-binding protein
MRRIVVSLTFLVLLASCLSTTTTGLVTAQTQTTFTVGWNGAPIDTLNPTAITLYDGGSYIIMHAIYDTLVRADMNANPIPDLAQSWAFPNSTAITFNLVHNATWHDGQPFTSDDVVFTTNLYLEHAEFPLMRLYVENVKSVSSIDKYTVQINLINPDATFVAELLQGMYILPKHIWETVSNFTSFENSKPIGTGPFKFASWGGVNSFVELTANPDYFLGRPHIDRLVMRYFTSYNAMALAIQSGEIDYTGPFFPPAIVPTLTSAAGVQVISRLNPGFYYLCLNGYSQGMGNPTLRDKTVRIALSHAINNTELAAVVWGGYAKPQNTVIPLVFGDWVNPNVNAYDFNLQEAAQILDSAGYKVGSDGIRVSPNGVRMSYKLEVPSDYSEEYRAAQMIAAWWKQIGVEAKAQMTETGALADEVVSWKHDVFIWIWTSAEVLGPRYYLSLFQSTEAQPAPNSGLSDSGFSNSTYDALFKQQFQEGDRAKRRDIIWQMQELLHQEAVYVPLYDQMAVQALRSDRFTGIPAGTFPPLVEFTSNFLFLNITPITAPIQSTQTTSASTSTTTPAATAVDTGTIAALAVVAIVVIIVIAVLATRRKSAGPARSQ